MKRLTSLIIAATLLLSLNTGVFAENISADDNAELVINSEGFIEDWSKVKYIGVDEYIEKYGGEKLVNKAFGRGEINHKAMLLKAEGKVDEANVILNAKNNIVEEPTDLMLSLKEGKFLGLEIESISDLPPDNINLSIRVKCEDISNISDIQSIEQPSYNVNSVMPRSNLYINNTHYDNSAYRILYSSSYPDNNYINNYVYEDFSGSYFYKYGYSWMGDYRCTTDVTFNNTELKTGTQNVNMYVFIGAVTDATANRSIDFGLMANPLDNLRNAGLYGFRSIRGVSWDVDAYPKVHVTNEDGESANPMFLENKTIQLKLVIDQSGGVETTMYHNNQLIYYKSEIVSGLCSGTNKVLTFFQAMSCVDRNKVYTNPSSGAYFKNVRFDNTKLCSHNSGERAFGTYGNNTYYVYICKPEDISYSYGTNYEIVSIEYN